MDMASGRKWIVTNIAQKTGYALLPGENAVPFAAPESWVRKRAAFLNAHLWVTPYKANEIYAGGDYPNQPAGLPVLTDYQFPAAIPTAQFANIPDGSGWAEAYNTGRYCTTSGGVLQMKYPAGYTGGGAPCTIYNNLGTHPTLLYTSFGWTPSVKSSLSGSISPL